MNQHTKRFAERDLAKETAAAHALKEALRLETDDTDALRDMIEGETNLHEAISAVIAEVTEDEILITGIEVIVNGMQERAARLKKRIEFRRTAIERAMVIGELQALTLPEATISLRQIAPNIEIQDEAKIPARFWNPRDPTLDRAAIKDAIKSGEPVEGVTMDNGGIGLTIRRK